MCRPSSRVESQAPLRRVFLRAKKITGGAARKRRQHAEEKESDIDPRTERRAEDEAPDAEADKKGEDIESHRLPALRPQVRDDAGEKRLRQVIAEGEQCDQQRGISERVNGWV